MTDPEPWHGDDAEVWHDSAGNAFVASIQECPECGGAVMAKVGEVLTGCASHTP